MRSFAPIDRVLSGAAIICLAMSIPLMAAPPSFSVDSYIPEKFTDFEWSIRGNTRWQGLDRDAGVSYPSYYPNGDTRWIDKDDYQDYTLGTYFEYRYETIPRIIRFSSDVGGYVNVRSSYNGDFENGTDGRTYESSSDLDETVYRVNWAPSVSLAQYVASDLFIQFSSSARLTYLKRPDIEQKSNYLTSRIFDDTTIYMSSRTSTRDGSGEQKNYSCDLFLTTGWGRVYEGEFAATALFMIDELKSAGIVLRDPTYEEMTELTEIIYQYRLKHAVDSRLHRIEALDSIIAFLDERGIIADTASHGAVLIEDTWNHFPKYSRRFGAAFSIGGGYEYDYSSNASSSTIDENYRNYLISTTTGTAYDSVSGGGDEYFSYFRSKFTTNNPYLTCMAEYYKPLDTRWQVDLTGQGWYYINAENRRIYRSYSPSAFSYHDDYSETVDDQKAYFRFLTTGEATYIFDTRTTGSISASYEQRHFNAAEYITTVITGVQTSAGDVAYRNDLSVHTLHIRGQLQYRISIPTTLTISLDYITSDIKYHRETIEDYDNSQYMISATVQHYLF